MFEVLCCSDLLCMCVYMSISAFVCMGLCVSVCASVRVLVSVRVFVCHCVNVSMCVSAYARQYWKTYCPRHDYG